MSLANFWKLTSDSAFVTVQNEFISYMGKIWPREKIMESIKAEAAKNSFFLCCKFKLQESWTSFFHPSMVEKYLKSIKCDLNLIMVSEEEFYLSPIPNPLATLKLREILYGTPISNFDGGCPCPDCTPTDYSEEEDEEECHCGDCSSKGSRAESLDDLLSSLPGGFAEAVREGRVVASPEAQEAIRSGKISVSPEIDQAIRDGKVSTTLPKTASGTATQSSSESPTQSAKSKTASTPESRVPESRVPEPKPPKIFSSTPEPKAPKESKEEKSKKSKPTIADLKAQLEEIRKSAN